MRGIPHLSPLTSHLSPLSTPHTHTPHTLALASLPSTGAPIGDARGPCPGEDGRRRQRRRVAASFGIRCVAEQYAKIVAEDEATPEDAN